MAKRQGKQNHKRMVVSLRYMVTPDGNARLSRAIFILLKAAEANSQAEDTSNGKKEAPHGQAPARDVTGGSDRNDSHDEG